MWRARPVRGEVGIIFAPESNIFNYLQQGSTDWYAESARGAYQGFFDLNFQADWVHIDDVMPEDGQPAAYRLLYLPYPIHLRPGSAAKLRAWVEQGGTLVSEGCPGYYGDGGKAGTIQPNLGLGEVFGARERYVEFTPDISDDVTFSMEGGEQAVPGALFIQAFEPAGGKVTGTYAAGYGHAGGLPAVIDHTFGKGRTRLIGTFPGAARHRAMEPVERRGMPSGSTFTTHRIAKVTGASSEARLAASRAFFAGLLEWAGVKPHVRTDNSAVIARLHEEPEAGGLVLWVLNPTRETQRARLTMDQRWGPFSGGSLSWGDLAPSVEALSAVVEVGGRNAAVVRLQR